jgi:hypothetical protein
VFDSETDAGVNGAVIGCVSRHRYFADIESFARADFNDVNGERTIGAQVIVMGVSVALVEGEHGEHRVNDLASAHWSNNLERNVHWHHDPTRGDEIVEIGDVIAVKVSDQNGADHSGQNASAEQAHDGGTTTVDHDVLLTSLNQGARTRTIGVGDWATSTEKNDFHEVSMSHK